MISAEGNKEAAGLFVLHPTVPLSGSSWNGQSWKAWSGDRPLGRPSARVPVIVTFIFYFERGLVQPPQLMALSQMYSSRVQILFYSSFVFKVRLGDDVVLLSVTFGWSTMVRAPGEKANPSTIRSMVDWYLHPCMLRTQIAITLFLEEHSKGELNLVHKRVIRLSRGCHA